jgi:signal transduction histidine kinase
VNAPDSLVSVSQYRALLAAAGSVYFIWWFAVELFLPGSFNPLPGRLAVVGYFVVVLALSFASASIRNRLRALALSGLYVLTAHFFWLFYGNHGDNNWVIGSFITGVACTYAFLRPGPLLAYSLYFGAISLLLLFLLPPLRYSVFAPGVLTILFQANLGMRLRQRSLHREEEARAREEAMRDKVKALDAFISLASHELKTPLTSMKLWNQMSERELAKASDKKRSLEIARLQGHQISRLIGLVETMLNTSQLSDANFRLERHALDFAELARDAVTELGPAAERSGTPVTFDSPETISVEGDAARLHQVVENLLTNAMKFGGGKPIRVTLRREGAHAVLRVADLGVGIEARHLERIFERFERVDSTKNVAGLGLGLYLVRELVHAHGGSVNAESVHGRGSTFTVRLPALPPSA